MSRALAFTVAQGAATLLLWVLWAERPWCGLAVWVLTFGVDMIRGGLP